MTITETRPGADAGAHDAPTSPPAAPLRPPTGLAAWLSTGDHKKVGRLFAGFALLFLLADLVVGGLLGAERIDATGASILHLNAVAQLYSLYQFGLAFLVVIPLLLGLAIAIVPLQVGARSIAFPRAAALSFWTWLMGAVLVISGYISNGGPGGGNVRGVNLFLTGMVVVVVGLLVGCVCVVSTVIALRASGMELAQVPFFAWSWLVTASMLLITLPLLLADLIFVYVDHRYGRQAFGGNAGISTYLNWSVSQPQTYLYALPVLGFAADVVPVFGKARQKLTGVVMAAIGLAGLIGFGVFEVSFYADAIYKPLYIIASVTAPAAVLVVMAAGTVSMLSGKVKPKAPLFFALFAGLMLLVGTAVGVLVPFKRLHLAEFGKQPTVYLFSQFNYVLLAAALAGLGGIVYWGPKLWGRLIGDKQATGLAFVATLGIVLVALPDVILGFAKQPFGEVNFKIGGPHRALNAVSTAGYALLLLAVLGTIGLALRSFTGGGESAGDDPWDGHTLEWATSSPPPDGNFPDPVTGVASAQPLLDRKEA
jgi:cytochrome o ubiquinol oxidase subunit 1